MNTTAHYLNTQLDTNEANWVLYYETKYLWSDLYVSDSGLLCRYPHNGDPVHIVVPTTDRNGYLLGTGQNRNQTTPPVHQLVWDFHGTGPVPSGSVIDHINENKTDNRIENLQILTIGQNASKSLGDGRRKGQNNPNRLTNKARQASLVA